MPLVLSASTPQFSTASQSYEALERSYESQSFALIEYKQRANYWRKQFSSSKEKHAREESLLKDEIALLKAKLLKREQQLFGRKSEKKTSTSESSSSDQGKKRPRGQVSGKPSPDRRDYSELPIVEEKHDLAGSDCCCDNCGLEYSETSQIATSEIIEIINVQAYKRRIVRKIYRKKCSCPGIAEKKTALVVPKLLEKSNLGLTIWSYFLLNKFEYHIPLSRLLDQLSVRGLSLSAGTITGGFQNIAKFFTPVYDAIVERSLSANHWHADETRWKVFEKIEGKDSYNWMMWIFINEETAVLKICPNRSSQVLIDHFGTDHGGGTLNVDRYCAYKTIAKAGLFILAFCWAHVRRDYLQYSKSYPADEEWGLSWVKHIANLYHINNQRIKFKSGTAEFLSHDKKLRESITKMKTLATQQQSDETIPNAAKKLLISLMNHWDGLVIFVENPDIPMDNNTAERGFRPEVVGRKNYYGSGSVWSSELAAYMFSIFKTLKLWGINPSSWILAYLQQCALQKQAPDNLNNFLPWTMDEQQKKLLSKPPIYEKVTLENSD